MRKFFTNFFVKSRKFFIRIKRKDDIMEKAPSEYAKYWTSPENEVKHFKHATQFGLKGYPYKYSKKAVDFFNDKDSNIRKFTTKDGTIYRYRESTNEFMMVSRDGKIITYYPPRADGEYFENLFLEYGYEWL